MAVQTLKQPAVNRNDPGADLHFDADAETPKPLRVPKITRGAQVATTIKYTADIETNEENESNTNGTSQASRQNENGFRTNSFNHFERETENEMENLPANRLADLFDDLRGVQEYPGQRFYAFITRRADMMNDKFRFPCRNNEAFQPMEITAQSMLDFIPTIQRHNHDSGGRFDVRISDENGQDLGIGLAAFTVADPVVIPVAEQARKENSGLSEILQLMMQQQQKSDERFQQVLIEMNKPKDDEFLNLVKEKMRNDFLNPPENKSKFSSEEMIAGIFQSQMMIQTLSEKFASQLGAGKDGEKKSTLEMILGNEVIMERAGDVIENIVEATQTILAAKMQPNGQPQQPQPQQNGEGFPPLPPQPETVQDTTQVDMNREIINRVIAELETDSPITFDNPAIKEFQAVNPDLFQMLKGFCIAMPFNIILGELEKLVPDTFEQFYDGEELNERGEKVERRLEEFYYLLKGEPMPAKEAPLQSEAAN